MHAPTCRHIIAARPAHYQHIRMRILMLLATAHRAATTRLLRAVARASKVALLAAKKVKRAVGYLILAWII